MATSAAGSARARGRRAKPRDRSFASTLSLTVLGAVLPGSGYVAAGRRFIGFVVLTIVGAGLMLGVGVLLVEHRPAVLAAEIASRPALLSALGIGLLVAATIWVVIVITSHLALRPPSAPAWQRGIGLMLALTLCGGIVFGSVYGARAAFATHSLVKTVFTNTPVDASGDPVQISREDPWQNRPRLNVLLLGADAGDDREGLRTDSVILASINTSTGDTVLFSLPRNLEDVPFREGSPLDEVWPDGFNCGYENGCILNAVYGQGELYADEFPSSVKDPGVAAVSDAVSATLGLDIDFYLMVDLGGFERLVDALGGIDINVGPDRVPIIGGTGADGQDQPEWAIEEWIEPGAQHLDGREALWFSRSRWRSDDYERMERQRCVHNAVVDQADPGTLLANYLELAETAEDIITTDVPYQLFPAFLELAGLVQGKPVRTLPFTNDVIVSANPDLDLIRDLVQAALVPAPPAPPTTSTPSTTSPTPTTPGETVSPTPTTDPTQAVEADAVCG
jgi:LCP family protein required for cell wall assembly